MAEARTEDEEESLRESRGGRNPRLAAVSSERAERNKPEQRQSSQGALSSIRAAIKRTSNRTTGQTDHSRDRRRPEITILSAEPLASNSWFPGASGAFPPPPPPPAQPSWASTGLTVHLPPPSYEQVIREKSREQILPPPSLSSSSSSTSSSPSSSRRSTVTIATQTDTHASKSKNRTCPPARRPPKPPRPSLPLIPKPAETSPPHTHTPAPTHTPSTTHTPLSEQCGVQTDFSNVLDDLAPQEATPSLADSSHNPPPTNREGSARPRPRPRPRSTAILASNTKEEVLDQPPTTMTREVKVQTLVRLKDDGAESVFAGFTDSSSDVSSNKYLQELLDAFAFDEQSFQGDQSSESDQNDQNDQSDQSDQSEKSEDEEEAQEDPDFFVSATVASTLPPEPSEPLKRPEPRPRTQNPKPAISPKPSEPTQDLQESEKSSEEQSKPILNHPVPAPRPLLTNRSSETNKPDQNVPHQPPHPHQPSQPPRPPVAARRSLLPAAHAEASQSGPQTPEVPPKSSVDDQHVEQQHRNSSSAPVKPTPVPSASRTSERCPPSQRRPPPPSSTTNTQAAVGGVIVSKAPVSSAPCLPPRPKEGKMLPLRPPPMKLPKSAGSSHVPATTNQQPSHRVPKRGPPLPPRPKPGHPLYREYTQKEQKEELLLDLDDTLPPTHPAVLQREVKGRQDGPEDVCLTGKDELVSQQKEVRREQQEEQQLQPNTVQFVSRFAFEGEGDELSFREGDVITLLEYVNEEWGRGSLDGQTGLFPLNFVQEEKRLDPGSPAPPAYEEESVTGRAMYDFTPESEDELCLKVGDIVCALEEVDEEWYTGEFGGKRGIVPKNFIQVL